MDEKEHQIKKDTVHSMKRRSSIHDYSRGGYYHITIGVAQGLHQPFGRIAGRLDRPDGNPEAPHVELSAIGRMVQEELGGSISRYYPMLEVMEYVIMPEHVHFLLAAHGNVVSKNGRPTHLGQVIAGFKLGCNKRYWAMTGRINLAAEPPGTVKAQAGPTVKTQAAPAVKTQAGPAVKAQAGPTVKTQAGPAVKKEPLTVLGGSAAKEQLPPLFDAGYCDVMPVDEAQLATQRAYIIGNPRSRLLRTSNRSWLQPQRNTIDTAVNLRALQGYLMRECRQQLTEEAWGLLEKRLLLQNGRIACDSYGPSELLDRRLLPVVCHRKDASLFAQQRARCLEEADAGAVLVSARISKGEQEILDSALRSGHPVIRIEDNGFPEIYHPSSDRMDDCAGGLLLLVTPWEYQFRGHQETISVPFCKTMNCLAQAICKTKDDWWKSFECAKKN